MLNCLKNKRNKIKEGDKDMTKEEFLVSEERERMQEQLDAFAETRAKHPDSIYPDLKEDFFRTSTIERNVSSETLLEWLSAPGTVNKMLVASEMGLPAITPIIKDLEDHFDTPEFPLNTNGDGNNAKYRRNVGWFIRYVLSQYGMEPIESSSLQSRIPASYIPGNYKDENGNYIYPKYFSYGAKYRPAGSGKYFLVHKVMSRN